MTAQTLYTAEIAAGRGDDPGATIRDADNISHTLTFAQAHAVLLAMGAHGAAILQAAWALKDEIEATPDRAALDAIDIAAGWP